MQSSDISNTTANCNSKCVYKSLMLARSYHKTVGP